MTKEQFNRKYKDKFRINYENNLEQPHKCECDHCQNCQYSKIEEWIEFIDTKDELEMLYDYSKVIEPILRRMYNDKNSSRINK